MEQNWERGRQGVAVRTRVLLLWYWWCHQCTWAVNRHMLRTDLTLWNLQYVSPAWTQGLSIRKGVRHGFLHTCLKEDLVPGEGQRSRISAKTVGRDRRTELRRRGKDRDQLGCNDNTGERIVDFLANTEGKSQLFRVTTGSKIWCPLCAETSGSC